MRKSAICLLLLLLAGCTRDGQFQAISMWNDSRLKPLEALPDPIQGSARFRLARLVDLRHRRHCLLAKAAGGISGSRPATAPDGVGEALTSWSNAGGRRWTWGSWAA